MGVVVLETHTLALPAPRREEQGLQVPACNAPVQPLKGKGDRNGALN